MEDVVKKIKEELEEIYKSNLQIKFVVAEFVENSQKQSVFISRNIRVSNKRNELVINEDKLKELLEKYNKIVIKKICKSFIATIEKLILIENKEIKDIREDIKVSEAEQISRQFLNIQTKANIEKALYIKVKHSFRVNEIADEEYLKELSLRDVKTVYVVDSINFVEITDDVTLCNNRKILAKIHDRNNNKTYYVLLINNNNVDNFDYTKVIIEQEVLFLERFCIVDAEKFDAEVLSKIDLCFYDYFIQAFDSRELLESKDLNKFKEKYEELKNFIERVIKNPLLKHCMLRDLKKAYESVINEYQRLLELLKKIKEIKEDAKLRIYAYELKAYYDKYEREKVNKLKELLKDEKTIFRSYAVLS